MFIRLVTLFSFCIVLASCKKSSTDVTCAEPAAIVVPASEMTSLQAYIAANHPTAVLSPKGFYYEILAAGGSGADTIPPSYCAHPTIAVRYAGYLTNGFKFDENTTGTFLSLRSVIAGWQLGVPLIKKGGSINLYIPPSLGYGANATTSIPGNSILVFSIQLMEVL